MMTGETIALNVAGELKRMRSLATEMRHRIARQVPGNSAVMAESALLFCDLVEALCEQIEELDRRLRKLEGGK